MIKNSQLVPYNSKIAEEELKFSVFMPVCAKEKPENMEIALGSIINQTLMPDEILIAEDGPVPDALERVIWDYENKYKIIRVIRLDKNIGIGPIRALGVENCQYDIIAFMDSDDISANDRFEKQIEFIKNNPDIDVVGTYVTEFDDNPDNIYSKRHVPTEYNDIYQFAKFRMPVNNNTVMFKKKAVLDAGNYRDFHLFEDYELYARMLNNGYKLANIPDYLVNMRGGSLMMQRRRGIKYFINCEYKCFKSFMDSGFINRKEFLKAVSSKFFLRIVPPFVHKFIYIKLLRKSK